MDVLVGLLAGAALLTLWATATRRQLRRRAAADWDGAQERPDLWTSGARCPACGASGGLLTTEGEALWFSCLSCGARHQRDQKA